jgi:hypothetical protein
VGFTGVSGDPADAINEMAQPASREHLLVSGAVFVGPRAGVGIETFPEHDTSLQSTGESIIFSDQLHEKTALMVTARGRAVARSRFAIDGVFGVGALQQTRTSTFDYRDPRIPTTTYTSDHTSAAFSVGADATIPIARHVALIPQIRWYHLRRLGQVPREDPVQASPLDTPASLFAFGVTAGISW